MGVYSPKIRDQALVRKFGHRDEQGACQSIDEVIRVTAAQGTYFGNVPVENSSEVAVNLSLRQFGDPAILRMVIARGGDIDLLVTSPVPVARPALLPAQLASRLQLALGEEQIDTLQQQLADLSRGRILLQR